VATNATLAAEAVAGCVVMDVVIVAVGTPTVASTVNGHPVAGGCSIHQDGNLKNSKSSDDGLYGRRVSIPNGVSITGICTPVGMKSVDVAMQSVSS